MPFLLVWHTLKLFMVLLFTTASDLGSLGWPLHLCSSKQGLQEDDPPGKEYVTALIIRVQNWVEREALGVVTYVPGRHMGYFLSD